MIFKLYPIYQTSDGRIYLTRGNSMGMSGSDGASITHTLTRDKTETIGGKSERVKVRVAITAVSRSSRQTCCPSLSLPRTARRT